MQKGRSSSWALHRCARVRLAVRCRISLPHFSDYKEWGKANRWPTRSIFVPGVPLDLPDTCWQIGESSVFIEIVHESLID